MESWLTRPEFQKLAKEIAEVGRFLAHQKWSPATSSNYSAKLAEGRYALTRSGVDKYNLSDKDILVVDQDGVVVEPVGVKPSAETLIHCCIYKKTGAGAVLHTHSVYGTRLSMKFANDERIVFSGYEILKGLGGNTTHELTEIVPILENSQDMPYFCSKLEPLLEAKPEIHGFLIAGHGLYTWGQDLREAKRHVETFEFMFEALAL